MGRTVRGMAKARTTVPSYRCGECGWTASKWQGRCGECQAWGTVEQVGAPRLREVPAGPVTTPAVPIGQVPVETATARPTGVDELDRVLGGGLVPGSVVLLAGEPGVGKSTLLLEVAARWAAPGHRALYVTGEESAAQVRIRAERVGSVSDELFLAAETDLSTVLGHVEQVGPGLLVVDSVQTVTTSEADGAAGGVTQVREVTGALIRAAKTRAMAVIIVGHVTKDGSVAGPRTLEHLVDVVLNVEGDRHARLRLVRALKNRYGPADEVGCFELGEDGIWGMPDPTGLFLTQRSTPAPGSCVTVTLEGTRPLLAEVQALVVPTSAPAPRRQTSGLDAARVAMVLGGPRQAAAAEQPEGRHLRGDGRRRPHLRARGRPRDRPRRRVQPGRDDGAPQADRASARSGCPGRSAASPAPPAGSPRRYVSASPTPSYPRTPVRRPTVSSYARSIASPTRSSCCCRAEPQVRAATHPPCAHAPRD